IAEVERDGATDNRLDSVACQFLRKFERPEHVVGIGERECRLAVVFGKLSQPRNLQRAFEQRIGRMNVQMHEAGFSGHWLRRSKSRPSGRVVCDGYKASGGAIGCDSATSEQWLWMAFPPTRLRASSALGPTPLRWRETGLWTQARQPLRILSGP